MKIDLETKTLDTRLNDYEALSQAIDVYTGAIVLFVVIGIGIALLIAFVRGKYE